MSVVIKKGDKIKAKINTLRNDFSQQDFIDKFKELYPKDWTKLEKAYAEHIRNTKPGKPVPMPKPEQYLKNALNVWKKQTEKSNER